MSREKEHIDKAIREKLLHAEVEPPTAVWGGIEQALAQKRKKTLIIFYRRIGAAAAILLLSFLTLYFVRSDSELKSSETKLAHQKAIDSALLAKDTVSLEKKNKKASIASEEKVISTIKQELENRNEVDQASVAQMEKNVDRTEEELFSSALSQGDYTNTTLSGGVLTTIAVRKPEQLTEIKSLYSANFNALSFIKAWGYKRILDYEDVSSLLAENSSKSKLQGWSVGLAFSPTTVGKFSGFSSKNDGLLYDAGENITSSTSSFATEKDLPAYTGGVNIVYQVSERWSFKSGIYYLKHGQRIENFSVIENSANASRNSNSNYGNISLDNREALDESGQLTDFSQLSSAISYSRYDADLLQRFELVEIPFLLSYKVINRRLVFSLAAGINQGFLVGNRVYLSDYSSKAIGKTEDVSPVIYKSVFGISFEYPLTRKLYFNFSPTMKYQLTNFSRNAMVGDGLQYFEIKTGLNYRF